MMFFFKYLLFVSILFHQNVYSKTVLSSANDDCIVKYGRRLLQEGQTIEIKGKLYKVEDCELHRAYHACGTSLLQMVSIACDAIQNQKYKTPSKRVRKHLRQKLLTEACCETVCTVAEMALYCPSY
ncbi:unnamed protein product [Adineta steineri]|uniref:Insulin-like domain-containing protein n=1 Tax=Adineta steineri TaxID=433720 RepID=A0A813QZ54_9BILA|nr:unnamed protein product [Adineta steineri]CAF0827859.1 unnamed protein product [Adineta steineri]CAF1162621.1 unnamed protein product [Adineta steineri]